MVGFSTMVGFFHIEKYWNFCAGAFFAICCGSICAACCCCQCCESVFKLLLFIWNYLSIWLFSTKMITTHLQVNEGKDPCHGSSKSHQVKICKNAFYERQYTPRFLAIKFFKFTHKTHKHTQWHFLFWQLSTSGTWLQKPRWLHWWASYHPLFRVWNNATKPPYPTNVSQFLRCLLNAKKEP